MLTKKLIIIDPLFEHLRSLIQNGDKHCLKKSIALYGSEKDMDRLQQAITKSAQDNPKKFVLVDLSPLPSLGAQKRFISLLELNKKIPFILVVRSSMALEQLQFLFGISVVITDDETGAITKCQFQNNDSKGLKTIQQELEAYGNIFKIRRQYFEDSLIEISSRYIQSPPDNSRYVQLHDQAWANQWIDVKSILGNIDLTLKLSYQMGYTLTNGYTTALKEDVLLVGNNTAYILGILLNKIFDDKKLIIIDKLGPFPKFSRIRGDILHTLNKKKILIVEDVIASGREVDLLALLALLHDANVSRAVCVFDLECATPRFIKQTSVFSLAKPSQSIGYERIPKYIGDKYVK